MSYLEHFILMSKYNSRMNAQVFNSMRELPEEVLHQNKGAFFGSLMGTVNHILVGDIIWLSRFSKHSELYTALSELLIVLPTPKKLDEILFASLEPLEHIRKKVDSTIEFWLVNEVNEADIERCLSYKNSRGIVSTKKFSELVSHLFNHQTHHRGQVTTLLTQLGIDIGITDYLIDIPNHSI
ncbi:DinB family protein [Pseudoalteromonas sp. S16_S37]|uniref:DinB family protein n=1 Tax=Pseudoalteromonas sp. S16_S37 TaxID=2720228 RepID=UPI00168075A3|nr:DinB family protein [Pseudoalteromonas sp. S16_S37]MBD1584827.1 damage-inducible protein DinB [Pseudoalteromonas sp. S16_S37]